MKSDESELKQAVKRLEAAMVEGVDHSFPFGTCQVRIGDVQLLFQAIKRAGGRRDWSPEEKNVADLPGPVRRYIRSLQNEVARYQRRLIELDGQLRKIEQSLARIERPPR
ncbi:MAG: hypothetical protein JO238_11570 [Alphaproteobacteria bacterium]|nr:hypothetical protein [Alphaproteobacteria bacterium]